MLMGYYRKEKNDKQVLLERLDSIDECRQVELKFNGNEEKEKGYCSVIGKLTDKNTIEVEKFIKVPGTPNNKLVLRMDKAYDMIRSS